MRQIARVTRFLAVAWLAMGSVGCSVESLHRFYPIPFYDTHPKKTRSPALAENPPRRIAILPFTFTQKDDEERRLAARALRESFYTALSRLRTYEVIPPAEVDRRLDAAGITAQTLLVQPPGRLGTITGADALLYGDLTRIANITLYVYSHTVYDGTFRLMDATGGQPLWTARLWEGRRAGLIVEGFFVDMFMSQPENRKLPQAYRRVANSMVAKLMESIPEPSITKTTAGGSHPSQAPKDGP